MKKLNKKLFAVLLAGVMTVSFASAKSFEKKNNKNRDGQKSESCPMQENRGDRHGFGMGMGPGPAGMQKGVIGQITETTKDSVTIVNADDQKVLFKVTPFTMIVNPSMDPEKRKDCKPLAITDLASGDWVIINPVESETKNKIAGFIIVKK